MSSSTRTILKLDTIRAKSFVFYSEVEQVTLLRGKEVHDELAGTLRSVHCTVNLLSKQGSTCIL